MRIEDTLSFNEYFDNPEFEYKKPLVDAPYDSNGDNIYYTGSPLGGEQIKVEDERKYFELETPDGHTIHHTDDSEFVQLDNSHHPPSRLSDDTPSHPDQQAVLISRHFWYFGEKEVHLPENEKLRTDLIKGYPGPDGKQGHKNVDDKSLVSKFVDWIVENYRPGVHSEARDQGQDDPGHEHTNC